MVQQKCRVQIKGESKNSVNVGSKNCKNVGYKKSGSKYVLGPSPKNLYAKIIYVETK